MSILNLKASYLEYLSKTKGEKDEDGNYIPSTSEWVKIGRCDVTPSGEANVITLPDGSTETYSFLIRNLPKDCRELKYGEKVRLVMLGQESFELKVKGFQRYQLQCKVWV